MPKVSVVIPSYNSGPFLRRAVDSVLAQTEPDLEVIVVDDGSREPQPEVAQLDDRIAFLSLEHGGVSLARNIGATTASAELLAFLDHDDIWLPRKLERQLDATVESPNAAFWSTRFYWAEKDRLTPSARHASMSYPGLLSGQHALLSSILVRRDHYFAAGAHNPLTSYAEDFDLILRLAMLGDRPPIEVPEVLVHYSVHENNASRDYRRIVEQGEWALLGHDSRARPSDTRVMRAVAAGRRQGRRLYAYQAIDVARGHVAHGRPEAVSDLAMAARLSPAVLTRSLAKAAAKRVLSVARTIRRGGSV